MILCSSENICVENIKASAETPLLKTRWAIVALTKPGKQQLNNRNEALARIIKPYASLHDITIIFFSEFTFLKEEISQWERVFNGIAKTRIISTANLGFNLPQRYGYKYMCKFFGIDIYNILSEYDYYLRCDSDCIIESLNYDVFAWAENHNVGYGYALRKLEAHAPTRATLPAFTKKYMSKCNVNPSSFASTGISTCFNFYNNLHIAHLKFFKRNDVAHYLTAVNDSGNILNIRWGDSTIQAYAVRLFMPQNQVQLIPNITYVHGSHGKLVTTFGDGSGSTVPQRLPG